MASNTRITRAQKEELKAFKATMPKNMAFATVGRLTVLVEVDTNVVRFATAVASPDEIMIRRKVGEYNAMERWQYGQTALVPRYPCSDDVKSWAQILADMLAG